MKKIDLTGQRFGRLTVIEPAPNHGKNTAWRCRCDCGNVIEVTTVDLKKSHTKSCGCWRKEQLSTVAKAHYVHRKCKTRIYTIWRKMKERCNNPNFKFYESYGGRGIKVCQEWTDDFQAFYDWAMANGYQDGLQIDRIDNNGGYTPGNCQWVTAKQNMRNRRVTVKISFQGKTQTISEWATELGLPETTIRQRYRVGKTPEEIMKK